MHVHLQGNGSDGGRLVAPGIVGVEAPFFRAFGFQHQFLGQQVSNTLNKRAFHLANVYGRIQAPAHVIDNVRAQYFYFAGEHIHFNHRTCARIGESDERIHSTADAPGVSNGHARNLRLVFYRLESHRRNRRGPALERRREAANQVHAICEGELHQVLPDESRPPIGGDRSCPSFLPIVPEINASLLTPLVAIFFEQIVGKIHETRAQWQNSLQLPNASEVPPDNEIIPPPPPTRHPRP